MAVEQDWRPAETFTLSGQNNPVIVAVPAGSGGWIVGEAWRRDEGDTERDNGWWWAGTGPGDYFADPIWQSNHGDVQFWMPLPKPPANPPKGGGVE